MVIVPIFKVLLGVKILITQNKKPDKNNGIYRRVSDTSYPTLSIDTHAFEVFSSPEWRGKHIDWI